MSLDTFEHKEVQRILDALQARADSITFSRETLELSESRSGSAAAFLHTVFGLSHLSNDLANQILMEVHHNYLALAHWYLPVDPNAPEEEIKLPVNGVPAVGKELVNDPVLV